jgi:hypothetical protein
MLHIDGNIDVYKMELNRMLKYNIMLNKIVLQILYKSVAWQIF